MEAIDLPNAIEPTEWFVVFHPETKMRWLALLAFGRFKHVSAFAYCPGFKAWLLYDTQWGGTRLILFPAATAKATLMQYTAGCAVVKIARALQPMGPTGRVGFNCVTAIRHLLGVRCAMYRPDALYRYILQHGGQRIDEGKHPVNPG